MATMVMPVQDFAQSVTQPAHYVRPLAIMPAVNARIITIYRI